MRMQVILCSWSFESLYPPFGLAFCGIQVHALDSSEEAHRVH